MKLETLALHHTGIVMRNQRVAENLLSLLGLRETHRGYVPTWSALCIFAVPANGGPPVEFVVADSGPLKEFNRGLGGVHHVALTVPDLAAAMKQMAEAGTPMLSPEPVKGAGNFLCNFIAPVATGGALVELVEELPQ